MRTRTVMVLIALSPVLFLSGCMSMITVAALPFIDEEQESNLRYVDFQLEEPVQAEDLYRKRIRLLVDSSRVQDIETNWLGKTIRSKTNTIPDKFLKNLMEIVHRERLALQVGGEVVDGQSPLRQVIDKGGADVFIAVALYDLGSRYSTPVVEIADEIFQMKADFQVYDGAGSLLLARTYAAESRARVIDFSRDQNYSNLALCLKRITGDFLADYLASPDIRAMLAAAAVDPYVVDLEDALAEISPDLLPDPAESAAAVLELRLRNLPGASGPDDQYGHYQYLKVPAVKEAGAILPPYPKKFFVRTVGLGGEKTAGSCFPFEIYAREFGDQPGRFEFRTVGLPARMKLSPGMKHVQVGIYYSGLESDRGGPAALRDVGSDYRLVAAGEDCRPEFQVHDENVPRQVFFSGALELVEGKTTHLELSVDVGEGELKAKNVATRQSDGLEPIAGEGSGSEEVAYLPASSRRAKLRSFDDLRARDLTLEENWRALQPEQRFYFNSAYRDRYFSLVAVRVDPVTFSGRDLDENGRFQIENLGKTLREETIRALMKHHRFLGFAVLKGTAVPPGCDLICDIRSEAWTSSLSPFSMNRPSRLKVAFTFTDVKTGDVVFRYSGWQFGPEIRKIGRASNEENFVLHKEAVAIAREMGQMIP